MKRGLILSIVGVFLLACGLYAYVAWGKAHVPLDRVQICDEDGEVKNIKEGRCLVTPSWFMPPNNN